MDQTQIKEVVLERFGKVGAREFAVLQPLTADGIGMTVTNVARLDGFSEGDELKVRLLPRGNTWMLLHAELSKKDYSFKDTDVEAESRTMSAAERTAWGKANPRPLTLSTPQQSEAKAEDLEAAY